MPLSGSFVSFLFIDCLLSDELYEFLIPSCAFIISIFLLFVFFSLSLHNKVSWEAAAFWFYTMYRVNIYIKKRLITFCFIIFLCCSYILFIWHFFEWWSKIQNAFKSKRKKIAGHQQLTTRRIRNLTCKKTDEPFLWYTKRWRIRNWLD